MSADAFRWVLWHTLLSAFLIFSIDAAARVRVVGVTENQPGHVVVSVQTDEPADLAAEQFSLRVGTAASIVASDLQLLPVTRGQAALVICVDTSGSMRAMGVAAEAAALRGALRTAAQSRLPIQIAVIAFSSRTRHLTKGFTDDPVAVDDAVANLRVESDLKGRTHLNDAIVEGVAELRASSAVYRRLLVISDGDDEGSDINQTQLTEQLTDSRRIVVDTIGFGSRAAGEAGSLARTAGATSGEFVLANDQAALTETIYRQIRQFSTGARQSMTFSFQPASDGHVDEAQLLYRERGEPPQALVLPVKVTGREPAAQAVSRNPAPAEKPVSRWQLAMKFLLKFKLQLVTSLTGVFVITTVVVVRSRKTAGRDSNANETGQPPLPAPQGPQSVDVPPEPREPPPQPAGGRKTFVAYRWPLPSQGQVVAILEGIGGTAGGRQWRMEQGKLALGSASSNDLVFDNDDFISGHHAWIRAEDHALYLTDLGSTNGTLLNGQPVKKATRSLLPGDRISLGRAVIEIRAADPDSPGARISTRQRA